MVVVAAVAAACALLQLGRRHTSLLAGLLLLEKSGPSFVSVFCSADKIGPFQRWPGKVAGQIGLLARSLFGPAGPANLELFSSGGSVWARPNTTNETRAHA